MGVNKYKIKKWLSMLFGRGTLYVKQGLGKHFSTKELSGYFNDLTEKVTKDKKALKSKSLPSMKNENGVDIVFATTIFQYGLGCYDILLEEKNEDILSQFNLCVEWALANQDVDGGWDISSYSGKDAKYGSMAQSEGASLLLRAYIFFHDEKYLFAANRALNLMIKPISDFGTAEYNDTGVVFHEFTNKECVLNGWIFSIFGLFDYLLVDRNKEFEEIMKNTLLTLSKLLNSFDCGYWSMYDLAGNIASPFYHKLHIAQFEALCMICEDDLFSSFLLKLKKYERNFFCRTRAFLKKIFQKVFKKD